MPPKSAKGKAKAKGRPATEGFVGYLNRNRTRAELLTYLQKTGLIRNVKTKKTDEGSGEGRTTKGDNSSMVLEVKQPEGNWVRATFAGVSKLREHFKNDAATFPQYYEAIVAGEVTTSSGDEEDGHQKVIRQSTTDPMYEAGSSASHAAAAAATILPPEPLIADPNTDPEVPAESTAVVLYDTPMEVDTIQSVVQSSGDRAGASDMSAILSRETPSRTAIPSTWAGAPVTPRNQSPYNSGHVPAGGGSYNPQFNAFQFNQQNTAVQITDNTQNMQINDQRSWVQQNYQQIVQQTGLPEQHRDAIMSNLETLYLQGETTQVRQEGLAEMMRYVAGQQQQQLAIESAGLTNAVQMTLAQNETLIGNLTQSTLAMIQLPSILSSLSGDIRDANAATIQQLTELASRIPVPATPPSVAQSAAATQTALPASPSEPLLASSAVLRTVGSQVDTGSGGDPPNGVNQGTQTNLPDFDGIIKALTVANSNGDKTTVAQMLQQMLAIMKLQARDTIRKDQVKLNRLTPNRTAPSNNVKFPNRPQHLTKVRFQPLTVVPASALNWG